MVVLASKTWKIDIPQTVQRIVAHGIHIPLSAIEDDAVEYYYRKYVSGPERMRTLHREGRRALMRTMSPIQHLLERYALRIYANRTLASRASRFLFRTTMQEVEKAYSLEYYKKLSSLRMSSSRMFAGRRWSQLLAIPFCDLPERVCGHLFIGREGYEADVVYRSLGLSVGPPSEDVRETGVCMYENIIQPTAYRDRFGDKIFVYDDPIMALRLQFKHLKSSEIPIPLVGSYCNEGVGKAANQTSRGASLHIWDAHPEKEFIFWGKQITADLFNMAAACDARVYIGHRPARVQEMMPAEWLAHIDRMAKPWPTTLADALQKIPTSDIEILVKGLQLPAAQFEAFAETCPAPIRNQLGRAIRRPNVIHRATANGKEVTETPDGWFITKTNTRLCDAILRIEYVLYQPDEDASYYQGCILYNGEQVPFVEKDSVIERNTFNWMRTKLVEHKKGVMHYASNWSKFAVELAMQFHKPGIGHGVGRFGWQEAQNRFLLPDFQIDHSGHVFEQKSPVMDDLAPGTRLPSPLGLEPPDLAALTADTAISQTIWATAACVLANIIAPAINRPIAGIGLVGDGATVLGLSVARAMGCQKVGLPSRASVEIVSKLSADCSRHNWPVIFVPPSYKADKIRFIAAWLASSETKNAIVVMDPFMADALGIQGNWRFVEDDRPLQSGGAIEQISLVLVNWLVDFCKRKMQFRQDANTLTQMILHDLAEWVGECCNPEMILNAARLIDDLHEDGKDRARHLVSLLSRFVVQATLRFVRENDQDTSHTHKLRLLDSSDHPRGIFVSRAVLADLLSKKAIPVPDPLSVTTALADAGALEREMEYNGEAGWLVQEQWWNQQVKICTAQHKHQLRLVRGA
jgi:hypothetical protein